MMRKFKVALGGTLASAAFLAVSAPAMAEYVGSGVGAAGTQLPDANATAPAPSPVLPAGAIAAGTVLVIVAGAGAVARRRSDS